MGLIETAGHPEEYLTRIAEGDRFTDRKGVPGYVNKMPAAQRSSHSKMALHEEQERRALEGELWLLERAWEEAEEIAEISDNLFLPEGTDEFLDEHRGTGAPTQASVAADPPHRPRPNP